MSNESQLKLPYSFVKAHKVLLLPSNEGYELISVNEPPFPVLNEILRFCPNIMAFNSVEQDAFNQKISLLYHQDEGVNSDLLEGVEQSIDLNQLAQEIPQSEDLLESQDDAPIIKLLNVLLTQAIKQNASDIHIESFEQNVQVRLRVDGVLQPVLEIQRAIGPLLISRVKIMAKLDIAEKRIPQDGRISIRIAGRNVDIRVSTVPASHGERIVLRILDKESLKLDFKLLGLKDEDRQSLQELISHPNGIILVTGPTGSGKTTSLYAMLNELNQNTRNILTIEDPVEYDLPGIGQMQVNPKVEMTFAKGLRAILRQDPDIVMVGEIRDKETAEIAIQASLTGHLVLSTLHTNSALGAIVRLIDMGIEPFLLSSSILGLIAQRLVRTLCSHCKESYKASEKELTHLPNLNSATLYKPKGCDDCNQFGYVGRTAIYEVVKLNDELKTAIHDKCSESSLEEIARRDSESLMESGIKLLLNGQTSLAELLRVTS